MTLQATNNVSFGARVCTGGPGTEEDVFAVPIRKIFSKTPYNVAGAQISGDRLLVSQPIADAYHKEALSKLVAHAGKDSNNRNRLSINPTGFSQKQSQRDVMLVYSPQNGTGKTTVAVVETDQIHLQTLSRVLKRTFDKLVADSKKV